MVATTAITAVSMMKMNQAARFAACGEGWVIPMVLMKAFEMSRMNFTLFGWCDGPNSSRYWGCYCGGTMRVNRKGWGCI
jgi:hypothetical protein